MMINNPPPIKPYRIGSLFDGSGGFPLAASLCGIVPTWASEVEPYPIAVTRSRFPSMKHLGDVSKINGAAVEPVDVITFGSPCQDLSVAGKRAGLKHTANGDEETTRSGLFMEAVRIIREMRESTNGRYPAFALWENVPGAFSSNGGEDFRVVLEELIKIVEPSAAVPPMPKGGWPYADCYMGDGWSLAYRLFDAQYWGVPQRRRRIHLVLDLRGERAADVLFEREGVRGHFEKGGTARENPAVDAARSIGADDRAGNSLTPWDNQARRIYAATGVFPPLAAREKSGQNGQAVVYAETYPDVANTLTARHDGSPQPDKKNGANVVVQRYVFENHAQDARYKGPADISPMLPAQMGTGGNNTPLVVEQKPFALRAFGDYAESGKSSTILSRDYKYATDLIVEGTPVYCLQGNGIDCADTARCNGKGIKENISYTLNTIDRHAVAYGVDCRNHTEYPELYPTLQAKPNGGQSLNFSGAVRTRYIVRRLTPTECARLQGFPDSWGHPDKKEDMTDGEYRFWLDVRNAHAAINGKPVKQYTKPQILAWYNKLHTESAEYRMWGNGIALPPALYVMQGIADILNHEKGE